MVAKKGKSTFDWWFDIVNYTLLGLVAASVLYVLIFVLSASVSEPDALYQGKMVLFPVGFTLEGYQRVFKDIRIWTGYSNSILYTLVGTLVSMSLTLTCGYALSRKDLPGRGIFTALMMFTMFFSGGMIPTYLTIQSLGMLDTIWAIVIPNAVSVSNVIIARTFFASTLPKEMLEAAEIDGCSNTRYFFSIALPLSKSVIAVLALYYGVSEWNEFFSSLLYLSDEKKYPLQLILREILIQSQNNSSMTGDLVEAEKLTRIAEIIKYALIVVASLPMLMLYPFIQKHFVKGVMIGSVKG